MNTTIDISLVKNWYKDGLSLVDIKSKLLQHGVSEEQSMQFIENLITVLNSERTSRGMMLLFGGGFMGFMSGVCTFFNIIPNVRGLFLFGFTGLSVFIALYGLFLLVEKKSYQ